MARGPRGRSDPQPRLSTWRTAPLRLLWLAARRVRRGGAPLLAVSIGMLIAIVLLCAVPLYVSLGQDAQLRVGLRTVPQAVNLEVQIGSPVSTEDAYSAVIQGILSLEPTIVQQIAPRTTSYIAGPLMVPTTIDGGPVGRSAPALQGNYLQISAYDPSSITPHLQLIAGRLPTATGGGGIPEVLATPQSNLPVGAIVKATIQARGGGSLILRVVGIWFPKDQSDPYWNGRSFLPPETTRNLSQPTPYPLLMARSTYFASMANLTPPPPMTVHEIFYTDPARISASNMAVVASALQTFRVHLNTFATQGASTYGGGIFTNGQVVFATDLIDIISTVTQQFALSALPLYIVVVQVVGLALLFLVAMASLLVESQAGEIAVLKSRGASDAQALATLTAAGLLPALVVLVVGPFGAIALSLLLVRLGIPITASTVAQDLSPGFFARTALTSTALAPAAAGLVLGLSALSASAWQAARLDVLAFRREQARPTRVSLWRRYYLDLALAVLCTAGYLVLGQFGGLNVRAVLVQSGGGGLSLVELAAPAMLLLAGGLVLLRLIPGVLDLGFAWSARARGATPLLALTQLTRNAARFSHLALLLTLAVAMGFFALTFAASLGRNVTDRAAYEAGSDIRLALNDGVNETRYIPLDAQAIPALPGVTAATGITRTTAQTQGNQGNTQVPIVGIDPATFAHAAFWRGDFADVPLASLLDQMQRHARGASAGGQGNPIWALVSPEFAAALSLAPGAEFVLVSPQETGATAHFIVGRILHEFPTMYDTNEGYIVVSSPDLVAASAATAAFEPAVSGPNEYWLRVSASSASTTARQADLATEDLQIVGITERSALQARYQNDPVAAGMTALLLVGALLVACLAVIGGLVQSASIARQRTLQFAILRTLGMGRRELTNVILTEQLALYGCGISGGLAVGLILSVATLPYLEFASLLTDSAPPGVPSYLLIVNVRGIVFFLGVIALAFALGLLWQRQVAARVVLDRILRLGED
jgi:ABC-type lipoprotein release transport system permease subunit